MNGHKIADNGYMFKKPDAESVGSSSTIMIKGNRIYYHFVFTPYKRRAVLRNHEHLRFLYSSFEKICKDKGFDMVACKILCDHVHMLVGFDYFNRPEYVMRMIKGISARGFFQVYDTNRFIYRKMWNRSYYAKQVNEKTIDVTISYINNQTNDGVDKRFLKVEP